jgi:DNA-binding transcriptional LysR family regulator
MTTPQVPSHSRRYLRHGMLPQLVAFEAVVRLGSATRAAETLCMAQPTVSGHLRKLSEALGVRLFAMQGKHLVPTDAALALLGAAHEVFAALERCERVLVDLRRSSGTDACSSDSPQACASIPGDTVRINESPADITALRTHRLDRARAAAPLT